MPVSRTGYGVDVSATRADELERRLLAMVREGDRVLDLGCGAGGAVARLQSQGATVVGVDQHDFSTEWPDGKGEFRLGDVRELTRVLPDQPFDYCLCNRTLHYLPYDEAAQCLRTLRRLVTNKLYISFSGLTSDLVRGYTAYSEPIESRFSTLAPADQKIFGITAPLTLYTEPEALQLLTDTGWQVTWSRTTDFGNILLEAQS